MEKTIQRVFRSFADGALHRLLWRYRFTKKIPMRLLMLLLMLPFCTAAQNLSGLLTNKQGSPIPSATLVVMRGTEGTVIKSVLSDEAGHFRFYGLPDTLLRLQVSSLGYQTKDTVFRLGGQLVLALQLAAPDQTLKGVTVKASKPVFEVQPDKVVFNVGQSITAAGGNALELLQKSPGVLVDPNDAISMNGKSGVRIYIDGRPSALSQQEIAALLRSLPASDVEAIEIITNPSSRYESAGNGGIINIRLKKSKLLGTNGTLNGGWSRGFFSKYNGSLSLNHRTSKLNIFGSYSLNQGQYESSLNLYRFQNDSLFDQRAVTVSDNMAHNIKWGADYTLNKQHSFGLLVNSNYATNSGLTRSSTPIAAQSNKAIVQTLNAVTNSRRRRNNTSANFNYRFADSAGRVLSVDADYGHFDTDGRAATQNRYSGNTDAATGFANHTPVVIGFASFQASWEQKAWKGTLNTGLRLAAAKTRNTFNFFNETDNTPVLDQDRSNQFDYTESIGAAYVQYNRQAKKWSYQLGLRLEQTSSLGLLTARNPVADQKVKRSYLNAFPSVGVTYQVHQKHQLGLSSSRRIDRPSYQDLNPFENRLDELTYQKGNPFLRPQFTYNTELRHTYNYKLNTTLSYSNVQDFFAAITDTIEGRRNFITQRNIARQRIYSLSTAMPFGIAKWWNGYASVSVSRNEYRADFGEGKEININNTVANVYQQHNFSISTKWTAELSSFYLSPYVWAGNYECRSIWNIDLGMQRKLLKDQGTIKLTVTDIFRQMPWEGTSRLGSLYIQASGGWESRQVRLNFSYRFGNKEVKAARQRNTGLEDLNKRVQ